MNELKNNRWFQLAVGVAAMIATANLQYGWTLFVEPIRNHFHWSRTDIQWTFSCFVVAQTWLVPLMANFTDRFGPRLVLFVGAILVGGSWVIFSVAGALPIFYLGGIVGGVGAGMVYITSVGNALKWFNARRGLAAGITAGAFGGGSALTVRPMYHMIEKSGYQHAFLVFGLLQGAVILVAAMLVIVPRDVPATRTVKVGISHQNCTWRETLRTPVFWVLYLMFTTVAAGGLIADAQMGPITKSAGIDKVPISFFGLFSLGAVLPLALQTKNVLNGLSRPFFGWVSDHIGRELTMLVAFLVEAGAIWLMISTIHSPVAFILCSSLVFFTWGEIYSLFPAISGDLFGKKYATTNYALLYTAKGTASLLVPLGSYLNEATGSWWPIFGLATAFDLLAAVLAWFVLRPMARRWHHRNELKRQAEAGAPLDNPNAMPETA